MAFREVAGGGYKVTGFANYGATRVDVMHLVKWLCLRVVL